MPLKIIALDRNAHQYKELMCQIVWTPCCYYYYYYYYYLLHGAETFLRS